MSALLLQNRLFCTYDPRIADQFPLNVRTAKKRLLDRAVNDNLIIYFDHDPAIVAARLRVTEKGGHEIQEVIDP